MNDIVLHKGRGTRPQWLAAIIVAAAACACDSGPSESEFVAACLAEGQRGVNKAMSREMGIDRAPFCECAAKEAKATASPAGYHWMMLDMAGKRQDAAAVQAKMNEDERAAVMKAGMTVLGKCIGNRR